MKNLIILILVVATVSMGGYLIFSQKKSTDSSSVSLITPNASSILANKDLKTFTFDSFHGSKNISDKFEFKYPANWYNDGQYFSPEEIQYYDLYSVKAPLYFDLILASIFNQTEFKYQIDSSKRKSPDLVGKLGGRDFIKYDLIDYGSYGGESAGRVIILVGPKITVDGSQYYLVFHWEEKPLTVNIKGNDPKIFEQIVSSLKFI